MGKKMKKVTIGRKNVSEEKTIRTKRKKWIFS